jgi:hypothetical protein
MNGTHEILDARVADWRGDPSVTRAGTSRLRTSWDRRFRPRLFTRRLTCPFPLTVSTVSSSTAPAKPRRRCKRGLVLFRCEKEATRCKRSHDVAPLDAPHCKRSHDVAPLDAPHCKRSHDVAPLDAPRCKRSHDVAPLDAPPFTKKSRRCKRSHDVAPLDAPRCKRSHDAPPLAAPLVVLVLGEGDSAPVGALRAGQLFQYRAFIRPSYATRFSFIAVCL